MAGNGIQNLLVMDIVGVLCQPCSILGMKHCRRLPLIFCDLDTLFLAMADNGIVIISFGAIVKHPCHLRLIDRITIAHGQTDTGKRHTEAVLITPWI